MNKRVSRVYSISSHVRLQHKTELHDKHSLSDPVFSELNSQPPSDYHHHLLLPPPLHIHLSSPVRTVPYNCRTVPCTQTILSLTIHKYPRTYLLSCKPQFSLPYLILYPSFQKPYFTSILLLLALTYPESNVLNLYIYFTPPELCHLR